jgi:hypothetical protein
MLFFDGTRPAEIRTKKDQKKSLKVVLVPGFPPPLWEDPVIPRNRASSQSGLEP